MKLKSLEDMTNRPIDVRMATAALWLLLASPLES